MRGEFAWFAPYNENDTINHFAIGEKSFKLSSLYSGVQARTVYHEYPFIYHELHE